MPAAHSSSMPPTLPPRRAMWRRAARCTARRSIAAPDQPAARARCGRHTTRACLPTPRDVSVVCIRQGRVGGYYPAMLHQFQSWAVCCHGATLLHMLAHPSNSCPALSATCRRRRQHGVWSGQPTLHPCHFAPPAPHARGAADEPAAARVWRLARHHGRWAEADPGQGWGGVHRHGLGKAGLGEHGCG